MYWGCVLHKLCWCFCCSDSCGQSIYTWEEKLVFSRVGTFTNYLPDWLQNPENSPTKPNALWVLSWKLFLPSEAGLKDVNDTSYTSTERRDECQHFYQLIIRGSRQFTPEDFRGLNSDLYCVHHYEMSTDTAGQVWDIMHAWEVLTHTPLLTNEQRKA